MLLGAEAVHVHGQFGGRDEVFGEGIVLPAAAGDDRLRYLQGNAHAPAFIQSVTATVRYDAVIDLMFCGTAQFQQKHKEWLERAGHCLFVSSYRVFADTGRSPLTERSPRLLDVCTDKTYLW